ncbi:hypothetical protein HYDPIDRAFT_34308 [Hydnomerulius pinastri MD-312]|uniref:Uncharacterized protein n=1 Tax=Hydnomerulius pinastri MD-312 TaxID=994086 RepID=A0A0C9VY49_9AGAM|nr:hypothetical protein HYDPIDRAFT_34308 [Hydnomerulius pinastri MD-312]
MQSHEFEFLLRSPTAIAQPPPNAELSELEQPDTTGLGLVWSPSQMFDSFLALPDEHFDSDTAANAGEPVALTPAAPLPIEEAVPPGDTVDFFPDFTRCLVVANVVANKALKHVWRSPTQPMIAIDHRSQAITDPVVNTLKNNKQSPIHQVVSQLRLPATCLAPLFEVAQEVLNQWENQQEFGQGFAAAVELAWNISRPPGNLSDRELDDELKDFERRVATTLNHQYFLQDGPNCGPFYSDDARKVIPLLRAALAAKQEYARDFLQHPTQCGKSENLLYVTTFWRDMDIGVVVNHPEAKALTVKIINSFKAFRNNMKFVVGFKSNSSLDVSRFRTPVKYSILVAQNAFPPIPETELQSQLLINQASLAFCHRKELQEDGSFKIHYFAQSFIFDGVYDYFVGSNPALRPALVKALDSELLPLCPMAFVIVTVSLYSLSYSLLIFNMPLDVIPPTF